MRTLPTPGVGDIPRPQHSDTAHEFGDSCLRHVVLCLVGGTARKVEPTLLTGMVPRQPLPNPSKPPYDYLSISPPLNAPSESEYLHQYSPDRDETGSEADDECSSFSSRSWQRGAVMGPADHEDDNDIPEPSYPGEDTRPTSTRELLGFYTYSFAAEVFVVCGLGAFIPITLEDLARASPSAVLASDHSKSCKPHGIIGPTPLWHILEGDKEHRKGAQCVFRVLGLEVNTASFALYTFSISVLIQALVVVTMSGAADHGKYRKSLLIGFAVVGAIATMLFLPVTPKVYLLGSLWAIIGNVSFGASFVLLNSFLPLLVRWHSSRGQQVGTEQQREQTYDPVSLAISYVASFLDSTGSEAASVHVPLILLFLDRLRYV